MAGCFQEVRHASRNADSLYLFCIARDGKKGTLGQHFVTHVVPPLGCFGAVRNEGVTEDGRLIEGLVQ